MSVFPLTAGSSSHWTFWEILNYIQEMFSERVKPFGCGWWPGNSAGPAYPAPVVDSITDNGDGTYTLGFSGLDPDWDSGQWTGSKHTADCPTTPLRYDLAIFYGLGPPTDGYGLVRAYIVAQTQGSGVGTLTVQPSNVFLNAVTAKFIPSVASLVGQPYAIVPVGYPTFIERRFTRPNQNELWRGNFDPGWTATLDTGTQKFNNTGNAPIFPIIVPFTAVSSSHKISGSLSLNADGSFSGVKTPYNVSGGTNGGGAFDPLWNGVTFKFAASTYDQATGIGQIWVARDIVSPSPYDDAPGEPPQPPYINWKTDLYKGNDCLMFDIAGGLMSVFPDPATYPLSLGYDYTSVPTVSITGDGSSATATAVLGTSTAVVYFLITNGGSGYGTTVPGVSVTGTGAYAAGTAVLDGSGHVAAIELVISGTGFTSEPTVTIDPPLSGVTATARAILGVNTVASYTVTNPGEAYTFNPTIGVSGGGGTGAAAISSLNGSSKLLVRARIVGNDSNVIYFEKRPSDPGYSIPSSPLILDASQEFVIGAAGFKGMPGRHGDDVPVFYRGTMDNAVGHMPDGSRTLVQKMAAFAKLLAENDLGNCDIFAFLSKDIDVTYPSDLCNCGRWGYPVNVKFFTALREWQIEAIGLIQRYGNPETFGKTFLPENYTGATALAAIGANPAGLNRTWRRRFERLYDETHFQEDQSDEGGLVDPPVIDPGGELPTPPAITLASAPTGGALTHGTAYAFRVAYYNSSGHTLASVEQTITTAGTPTEDTYAITIGWPFQVGAEGVEIYGRTSGAETLMVSVTMPTLFFIDDGSITPPTYPTDSVPSSNTTHNDCNGVGRWISKPPSTHYIERTDMGYVSDGAALVPGDMARYMGTNAADAFPGGDRVTVYTPVDDRFYRGTLPKVQQLARVASRSGSVSYATPGYLIDTSKSWWTDEVNAGTLRVQGGTAGGGSTTTLTVSSVTGNMLCWWNAGRYIGLGGIFCGFILEIYKGGQLAGWTSSADGTATYTTPTAPGNTGTSGTTPTISAVVPGAGLTIIHATGYAQEIWVDGDHFDPACTGVLTNTDSGQAFPLTFGTVGFGEISLSFDFGYVAANWSLVLTNPGPHASSAFTFATHAVYRVPITSGSVASGTGTLGFTAVAGLTVAANDGWLIREPAYQMNKWKQRELRFTVGGVLEKIIIRYSDNQGLYFDTQATAIPVGTSFEIWEKETGEVLAHATAAPTDGRNYVESIPGSVYWVEPYILNSSGGIVTGSNKDARGGGDFLLDLNANLETKVTGYGYFMAGDDFTLDVLNQIYQLLLLCRYVILHGDWTNRGENNLIAWEGGDEGTIDVGPTWPPALFPTQIDMLHGTNTNDPPFTTGAFETNGVGGHAGPNSGSPYTFVFINFDGFDPMSGDESWDVTGYQRAARQYAYKDGIAGGSCLADLPIHHYARSRRWNFNEDDQAFLINAFMISPVAPGGSADGGPPDVYTQTDGRLFSTSTLRAEGDLVPTDGITFGLWGTTLVLGDGTYRSGAFNKGATLLPDDLGYTGVPLTTYIAGYNVTDSYETLDAWNLFHFK